MNVGLFGNEQKKTALKSIGNRKMNTYDVWQKLIEIKRKMFFLIKKNNKSNAKSFEKNKQATKKNRTHRERTKLWYWRQEKEIKIAPLRKHYTHIPSWMKSKAKTTLERTQ